MLEERNRDYNNTIHLLRNKLDVQDQYKYTSTSAIENHQKTRVQGYYIHHDVDTQFKQLQDQLLTKIEWLNSEFQHRMSTHELVMKHQLEMNELKFKMHLMEQQYNHRNISCQHDPYHRNICTPNVHFPGHSQPPPHPHIQQQTIPIQYPISRMYMYSTSIPYAGNIQEYLGTHMKLV
jgi:hypothetical protein